MDWEDWGGGGSSRRVSRVCRGGRMSNVEGGGRGGWGWGEVAEGEEGRVVAEGIARRSGDDLCYSRTVVVLLRERLLTSFEGVATDL